MLPDGSVIGGGSIFTWFATDVNGRLAMFLNNRFGPVPTCVQGMMDVRGRLRDLGELAWGESSKHPAFTVGGRRVFG